MTEKNLRAVITRDNGLEEDWGFYDLQILPSGTLALRCNEQWPRGAFDHFLAPGTWRQVDDVHFEE